MLFTKVEKGIHCPPLTRVTPIVCHVVAEKPLKPLVVPRFAPETILLTPHFRESEPDAGPFTLPVTPPENSGNENIPGPILIVDPSSDDSSDPDSIPSEHSDDDKQKINELPDKPKRTFPKHPDIPEVPEETSLKPLILSPPRPSVIPSVPTYRIVKEPEPPTNPTIPFNMKSRLFYNILMRLVRRR
jgi:hypothetical protein